MAPEVEVGPLDEARAIELRLNGEGSARMRRAIVDGLRSSIVHFADRADNKGIKDTVECLLSY